MWFVAQSVSCLTAFTRQRVLSCGSSFGSGLWMQSYIQARHVHPVGVPPTVLNVHCFVIHKISQSNRLVGCLIARLSFADRAAVYLKLSAHHTLPTGYFNSCMTRWVNTCIYPSMHCDVPYSKYLVLLTFCAIHFLVPREKTNGDGCQHMTRLWSQYLLATENQEVFYELLGNQHFKYKQIRSNFPGLAGWRDGLLLETSVGILDAIQNQIMCIQTTHIIYLNYSVIGTSGFRERY